MELNRIDKKIINFSYPVQKTDGYVKKKQILQSLKLKKEDKLNNSIDKLVLCGYIKNSHKISSHDGLAYELTEKGLELWNDTNKSVLEKIKQQIRLIIIPLFCILVSFILGLFAEEIKSFIIDIFG